MGRARPTVLDMSFEPKRPSSDTFHGFWSDAFFGRYFQRGFPSYFDPGAVRMDTIFNIVTFMLFSVLGCVVSVVKKRPLFSVYSGDDGKLLLDLPDSAPVSNGHQNETDSISIVDPGLKSDSQSVKAEGES